MRTAEYIGARRPVEVSRAQRVIAAAGAVLLLAGCSKSADSPSPESLTASTLPETSVATVSLSPSTSPSPAQSSHLSTPNTAPSTPIVEPINPCTVPYVPVFPFLHFKASNEGDIQKQLDVLAVAHDPHAEVTVDNLINAGSIVVNSLSDPVYDEAFTYANARATAQPLSASALIAKGFNTGDGGCLEKPEIQDTGALFTTLVDGLSPKVGHQLSAAAHVLYDGLLNSYQSFEQKYKQELGN